jgi:glycosyltransferase involved in cell wall biosynthesis
MNKITVITVCYNVSHLLPKTIISVLEQTYSNIEYIIIDGASTDNTTAIVESFKNKINLYVSEPDQGIYDAMNKGISLATGDIIIFLNAGDYFVSKDVLDFFISKINLRDADLFFGRIVWNDPKTKDIVLSEHSWINFSWDLKASNFPHPATLYKKILFDSVGLFDLNYTICADYDWNVRALVKDKIKFQYIDLIVTVFFADGVSNKEAFEKRKHAEFEKIDTLYYYPLPVNNFLQNKRVFFLHRFIEKLIAKFFGSRLSRVYY